MKWREDDAKDSLGYGEVLDNATTIVFLYMQFTSKFLVTTPDVLEQYGNHETLCSNYQGIEHHRNNRQHH